MVATIIILAFLLLNIAIRLAAPTNSTIQILFDTCNGYNDSYIEISKLHVNASTYCHQNHIKTDASSTVSNTLLLSRNSITSYFANEVPVVNLNDHLLIQQKNNRFPKKFLNDVIAALKWTHVYFYVDQFYGLTISDLFTKNNPHYVIEFMSYVENLPIGQFVSAMSNGVVKHHRLIVLLLNHTTTNTIMDLAHQMGLLNRVNHWLIFGDIKVDQLRMDSDVYVIKHVGKVQNLTSLIVQYISHFEAANHSSSVDDIMMSIKLKLYKQSFGFGGSVEETAIGQWTYANGYQVLVKQPLAINYHKATLVAVNYETPPYVLIQRHSNGTTTYVGYLVDVLETVAKHLNFTLEYVEVPNSSAFVDTRLQTIIGLISNRSADIGLFDFSLTLERISNMDFARVPLDTYALVGLFRRPDAQKTAIEKVGGYFEPLSVRVWLSAILAVVLLVSIYHIANYVNHHQTSLSNSVLLIVRTFSNQGTDENVHVIASGRIIFISLWMFSLLFAATYSATLMSYLAVTKIERPFKTLEELDRNKDYRIGFRLGSGSYYMFKNSPSEIQRRLFERSASDSTNPSVNSFEEGRAKAAKGKYVFMSGQRVVEYVIRDTCVFASSNPLTTASLVTITFQKDSPHTYAISRAFRVLSEAGILQRLRGKWWRRSKICSEKEENEFFSFTVRNVAPAFLILLVGIVLSFITMALEQCLANFKQQNPSATQIHVKNDYY
ncbi:hypothetical protein CHUAL_004419 [Chamberlinius hualienensis]